MFSESRGILQEATVLSVIPWFHAYGCLTLMMLTAIGARVVFLPKFQEHHFLNCIQVSIFNNFIHYHFTSKATPIFLGAFDKVLFIVEKMFVLPLLHIKIVRENPTAFYWLKYQNDHVELSTSFNILMRMV